MSGFRHSGIRPDWLATQVESALEPQIPVVDAHHHLYERDGVRYLFQEMLDEVNCGHDVRATVYVQGRAMYSADESADMQVVGETEFANGVAAMSASGQYGPLRMCAGLVGFADLPRGEAIRSVLERHVAAGGGRFRGVRRTVAWDHDSGLFNAGSYTTTEDMMESASFRAGFAQLAPLGLSFDAWLLFPQIPRLTALARAFPDTAIVLDHCGGALGIGRFEGQQREVFSQWKAALQELASCPNVTVKLSGLGMRLFGFGWDAMERAPSSEALAQAWRPWVETCLELFGASRCMYGSNFPVDKGSYGYGIGLNALKRLLAQASTDEKADVFWRSAARFYRLPSSLFMPAGAAR